MGFADAAVGIGREGGGDLIPGKLGGEFFGVLIRSIVPYLYSLMVLTSDTFPIFFASFWQYTDRRTDFTDLPDNRDIRILFLFTRYLPNKQGYIPAKLRVEVSSLGRGDVERTIALIKTSLAAG